MVNKKHLIENIERLFEDYENINASFDYSPNGVSVSIKFSEETEKKKEKIQRIDESLNNN